MPYNFQACFKFPYSTLSVTTRNKPAPVLKE